MAKLKKIEISKEKLNGESRANGTANHVSLIGCLKGLLVTFLNSRYSSLILILPANVCVFRRKEKKIATRFQRVPKEPMVTPIQ